MVINLRTIIKNILVLMGIIVLIILLIYDDKEANIIWKIVVISSPLLFSNLVIHKKRYEEEMRNDIESKALRDFMTYKVFEGFSIIFLLFLNIFMLTGIAYKYFNFSNNDFIYILVLYFICVPLTAKLVQKVLTKCP